MQEEINRNIAFISFATGRYVSAESFDGSLIANRLTIGDGEKFAIQFLDNNQIAIRSGCGWLSEREGRIIAKDSITEITNQERFEVIQPPDGNGGYGLRSLASNRLVCCDEQYGSMVSLNDAACNASNLFSIVEYDSNHHEYDAWPIGAHLARWGNGPEGLYTHHGIYAGKGTVIHYSGTVTNFLGEICETSVDNFSVGKGLWQVSHPSQKFDSSKVIERARRRLGEKKYNVIKNNCEHFCYWAIEDRHYSPQVESRKQWMMDQVSGMRSIGENVPIKAKDLIAYCPNLEMKEFQNLVSKYTTIDEKLIRQQIESKKHWMMDQMSEIRGRAESATGAVMERLPSPRNLNLNELHGKIARLRWPRQQPSLHAISNDA